VSNTRGNGRNCAVRKEVTGKRAEYRRAEITAARDAATRLPLKPIALVCGNPSLRTAASALIDVNAPSAFAQERVH
jgi:hypothetical protein